MLLEKIQLIFKKKFLHHTALVVSGSLVNGASLFALNIVLARALTQAQFGIFALSVLVLSTMGEISDFGLNSGLLRFGPYYLAVNQIDKFKQLVKTIWNWRVSLTAALTAGGIILAYPIARYIFGQPSLSPYITYASLGAGGVILLGFLVALLQVKQRFIYQATIQSLKGLLRLILVIILAVLGIKNLFLYLSIYIFVPWIIFVTNLNILPEKFRSVTIEKEVQEKMHSQLAHFSFWLTISSLVSIVAGKVDQAMISHFLGLEQVAIFTVAWQLIQFFPVISGSINSVLIPKISSLNNKIDLVIFIKRALKWVLFGTFIIGIIIYPSQFLIRLLFGQRYDAAMPVFLILAYSLLLNIIIIPFSLAVTVFNKTQIAALSGVIQFCIMVGCNFVFIPMYGIIGAAYTFAFGVLVQLVWNIAWTVYLIKKKELRVE